MVSATASPKRMAAAIMENKSNRSNLGVVVSVRGSVVDVRFDNHLPPIYSMLRAGAEKQIVIEVLAQLNSVLSTLKDDAKNLRVCILSPHPMVLEEFRRQLANSPFQLVVKQLESTLAPDLRNLEIPPAKVYVIDAHAAKPATGALLANIMERFPESRLIVVGEQHNDANSYSLLRLGVKGLLTYVEARDQLIRALPLVASGGFWVPRQLLGDLAYEISHSRPRWPR